MEFTGRLGALRHPAYFRYWSGSFASVGATQLQIMAQGWLLFELTESAVQLGYLGAAASIPAILMTLFGGALADRMNRKRLLMVTSALVAALMLFLAWLDGMSLVAPWHIILIAGLVSFISGFDWPTRQAIFPTLIHKQDMMSAVALNSIIWQSSRMIMPALGGVLIAVADTWLVFALCGCGFVTMFCVVATLPVDGTPDRRPGSPIQQIKEGLDFIFSQQLFLVFMSLSYAGMFFGMAHMQLMPAFAGLLESSEQGYGLLISATGVGSVIGTIVVGYFQSSARIGSFILGCAALSGVSVYIFAGVTGYLPVGYITYALAILALMSGSMMSSMFMIASMTILQLNVPDHLRGRVMGFYGITYSLMPLGGLLAGWIASMSSAPVAIFVAVTLYLIIIAVVAMTQREIRLLSAATR
ncbi:MAG: MFS family permease [Planctomycetaceae bacterium]|jgi:MFS family permease